MIGARIAGKRPEDRFGSADEMLHTLTAILRTQPEATDAGPIARSVQQARRALAPSPRLS